MLGGGRRDVVERPVGEQALGVGDGHARDVGAAGVHRLEAVFVGAVVHDLGRVHAVGAFATVDLRVHRALRGGQLVAEHHLVERGEALRDDELLGFGDVLVVHEAAHDVGLPRFHEVDGPLVGARVHDPEREPRALGDEVEHVLHDALVLPVALVEQGIAVRHHGHAEHARLLDVGAIGVGELDGRLVPRGQVLGVQLLREIGIGFVYRGHRRVQLGYHVASGRCGDVVRLAVELGRHPAPLGEVHVAAQHHVGGAVVQALRVRVVIELQNGAFDAVELEIVFEAADLLRRVPVRADGLAVEGARVEGDDVVVLLEADEQRVVRADGEGGVLVLVGDLLAVVHAADQVDVAGLRPLHEVLGVAVDELVAPSGVLGYLGEPVVEDARAHAVVADLADALDLGERDAQRSALHGRVGRAVVRERGRRRGRSEGGCRDEHGGHRRADAARCLRFHSSSLLRPLRHVPRSARIPRYGTKPPI